MKNLLILFCCLLTVASSAQITSKTLDQDTILYLTPAQEAFMIDKETKYLFKTGPLAFEQKMSEQLSVNFEFSPKINFNSLEGLNNINFDFEANLEFRNYWKLPSLIKEGKQANNLSSKYLGMGIGYSSIAINGNRDFLTNKRSLFVTVGDQKRFLNYGYVDFGVKVSVEQSDYAIFNLITFVSNYQGISISTYTNVGFALGELYDINEETKCPIFKCQLDRKSAFKINYNKMFRVSMVNDLLQSESTGLIIEANPNVSYERKLGSSSFSISQNLDLDLTSIYSFERNIDGFNIYDIRLGYGLGVRYYYNKKKNISRGKSGNNLSGFYVFLDKDLQYIRRKNNTESTFMSISGSHMNLSLGIGYQKILLENVYFDIRLAGTARIYTFKEFAKGRQFGFLKFEVGKIF